MDLPITKHTIKRTLADRLLDKLIEVHLDELEGCCSNMGITLSDLKPSVLNFSQRGTPSDTATYRYVHHEERRLAKILKAASELSKTVELTQSLKTLFKSLEIPTSPNKSLQVSLLSENFSSMQKPDDLIQYNIEKTKQKFNRSVDVIKRLEHLKAEENKRADDLIKKVQEKDRRLMQNLHKRGEAHGKNTLQIEENRAKTLQRKKKINENLDLHFQEFGCRLQKRLEKLSLENQQKMMSLMKKQQEKIRKKVEDDYLKAAQTEVFFKVQGKEIEKSVKVFEDKIENKLLKYEENLQKKVFNVKENNEKVEKVYCRVLADGSKRNEEKLMKAIEKSCELEQRRSKKQEKCQNLASTMKNSVMKSFVRTNRGIEGLNQREVHRIQQIENRVSEKTRLFNELKSRFEEEMKEKKQKNYSRIENHTLNYSTEIQNKAKFRVKIIEEHERMKRLAEDFKNKKVEISKKKKSDNFEIQKMRSAFTASVRRRYSFKNILDVTV